MKNKWWHTILLAVIILVLTITPQDRLPEAIFTCQDLVVHIIMYSSLAIALVFTLYDKIKICNNIQLLGLVFSITGYGFLMEVLQKVLPVHRFFSYDDIMSNFLGASLFYFIALRLKQK